MTPDRDGVLWGSAAEIAAELGHGVTPDMIRKWELRDGLTAARHGRQVWYRLDEAEQINLDKHHSRHAGRPRGALTTSPR